MLRVHGLRRGHPLHERPRELLVKIPDFGQILVELSNQHDVALQALGVPARVVLVDFGDQRVVPVQYTLRTFVEEAGEVSAKSTRVDRAG